MARTHPPFVTVAALAILGVVVGAHPPMAWADAPPPDYLAFEVLLRLNQDRAAAGLTLLVMDPEVVAVARDRAAVLAAGGYLAHVSPTGRTVLDDLAAHEVQYQTVGENLAYAQYPAALVTGLVQSGWMTSAGHRANILDPRFSRVGLGVAVKADAYYVIVIFLS